MKTQAQQPSFAAQLRQQVGELYARACSCSDGIAHRVWMDL